MLKGENNKQNTTNHLEKLAPADGYIESQTVEILRTELGFV